MKGLKIADLLAKKVDSYHKNGNDPLSDKAPKVASKENPEKAKVESEVNEDAQADNTSELVCPHCSEKIKASK